MQRILPTLVALLAPAIDREDVTASRPERDEFLPPGERIRRQLVEADGYLWQRDIASVTGWSAPKTSRILSDMEDEALVRRRRIGRQKLVYLPGRAPAAVTSTQRAPRSLSSAPRATIEAD